MIFSINILNIGHIDLTSLDIGQYCKANIVAGALKLYMIYNTADIYLNRSIFETTLCMF